MKHDEIEQIYIKHSNDVYLYALALCKDHFIAEELASDTFYKALLSLDMSRTSIKYWLFHVCKNLFIDLCRRKKKMPVALVDGIGSNEQGSLELILKNEERVNLYRAMLSLQPTDREMLTMFYFLDCDIAQIASHLGRSSGATKTGLSRARVRLKKLLEEETL